VTVLAIMLVSHFVADFLLQSRHMGKNKSIYKSVLFEHIAIQFAIMVLALSGPCGPLLAAKISYFNAVVHGVIDWNIWKGYKWSVQKRITVNPQGVRCHQLMWLQDGEEGWQYWEDHWFYATIGLDQLLHGLTLVALAGYFL
jgi:hypothetical protein